MNTRLGTSFICLQSSYSRESAASEVYKRRDSRITFALTAPPINHVPDTAPCRHPQRCVDTHAMEVPHITHPISTRSFSRPPSPRGELQRIMGIQGKQHFFLLASYSHHPAHRYAQDGPTICMDRWFERYGSVLKFPATLGVSSLQAVLRAAMVDGR